MIKSSRYAPLFLALLALALPAQTDPPAAALLAYGMGYIGSTGQVTALWSADLEGLPRLGNADFALGVFGARPGSEGWFFFADDFAVVPPMIIGEQLWYLDFASSFGYVAAGISPIGPFPGTGYGMIHVPVPVPDNPSLGGLSLYLQAAAIHLKSGELVTSNGLKMTLGI